MSKNYLRWDLIQSYSSFSVSSFVIKKKEKKERIGYELIYDMFMKEKLHLRLNNLWMLVLK